MELNFTEGKEGVVYDLPDAQYRKAPGVSNSMLKHIAPNGEDPGSPAHFMQNLKTRSFDTKALFFGRMVHSRILTPNEPLPGIVAQPKTYRAPIAAKAPKKNQPEIPPDGTTVSYEEKAWHNGANYCKDWNAEQERAGLKVLTDDEIADMSGVVQAVANNPIAAMALKSGKPEVSLFKKYWHTERMLLRKARLDWAPDGCSLVDIKTTVDARKDSFSSSLEKFRYYVQAAYYMDLWNELNPDQPKTNFIFIAVEKKAPYAIAVYDVHPHALEAGRDEYRRNLHTLLTCIQTNYWPAYSDDVQTVDRPGWAYKKSVENES